MTRLSPRPVRAWAAVALVAAAAWTACAPAALAQATQRGGSGYTSHLRLPPAPSPPRLVNDLVGLFSPAERDALERKLVAVDDSTGAQIAVVVVPSLDGADEVEYATEVLRAWGVGRAGVDNGVVLLVAPNDRKVAIATGYGAEGALTDATSGTIVRNTLVPAFRAGQFYGGVDAATDEIIAALSGEFTAPAAPVSSGQSGLPQLLCCLFLLFVVFLVFASRQKGGTTGGPTRRRRRSGPSVIFLPGPSFGGGWGGGGGGGGFGGGGFGGFGGGFGGGGGAGGSW